VDTRGSQVSSAAPALHQRGTRVFDSHGADLYLLAQALTGSAYRAEEVTVSVIAQWCVESSDQHPPAGSRDDLEARRELGRRVFARCQHHDTDATPFASGATLALDREAYEQRSALALCLFAQASAGEAGALLGISTAQVYLYLTRALNDLTDRALVSHGAGRA